MMIVLAFAIAVFLAFANGSNDNFKGVSTLYGSGTTNYKVALYNKASLKKNGPKYGSSRFIVECKVLAFGPRGIKREKPKNWSLL